MSGDLNQDGNLKSGWTELELKASTLGCTAAVVIPAKRDYAAAAQRAGNTSPKPFPDDEVTASASAMCACISRRIAETWNFVEYMADQDTKVRPLIGEAMSGGRCKPEGILAMALDKFKQK